MLWTTEVNRRTGQEEENCDVVLVASFVSEYISVTAGEIGLRL